MSIRAGRGRHLPLKDLFLRPASSFADAVNAAA
jgi:hypothetical protein